MRFNPGIHLALTMAAVALVGCAATTHHESTGQSFDDATITGKVKADLIEDPLTKGREISVTTAHGVVHLSGFVDSKEQRDEALRVAQAVPGVRNVDNGMQLKQSMQ
jgi:osmotically-inducible protein OsmY